MPVAARGPQIGCDPADRPINPLVVDRPDWDQAQGRRPVGNDRCRTSPVFQEHGSRSK